MKIIELSPTSMTEHRNLRHGARVNMNYSAVDVKWHPTNESMIVSASYTSALVFWNLAKRTSTKLEKIIPSSDSVGFQKVCWHPQETNMLFTGSNNGVVKIWDIRTIFAKENDFKEEAMLKGCPAVIRDLAVNPFNGHQIAAANDNGSFQIWDIRSTESALMQVPAGTQPMFTLDWHPSVPNIVATGSRDKTLRVWNLEDTSRPTHMFHTIGSVKGLLWRPEFRTQVVAHANLLDNSVNLWDITRPYIPLATMCGHRQPPTGMAWYGDLLLTCSKDNTIQLQSLKEAYKPYKNMRAVSLSWNASDEIVSCLDPIDRNFGDDSASLAFEASQPSTWPFGIPSQQQQQQHQPLAPSSTSQLVPPHMMSPPPISTSPTRTSGTSLAPPPPPPPPPAAGSDERTDSPSGNSDLFIPSSSPRNVTMMSPNNNNRTSLQSSPLKPSSPYNTTTNRMSPSMGLHIPISKYSINTPSTPNPSPTHRSSPTRPVLLWPTSRRTLLFEVAAPQETAAAESSRSEHPTSINRYKTTNAGRIRAATFDAEDTNLLEMEEGGIFNAEAFRYFSLNYVVHGAGPAALCDHNSQVANAFGYTRLAGVWMILKTVCDRFLVDDVDYASSVEDNVNEYEERRTGMRRRMGDLQQSTSASMLPSFLSTESIPLLSDSALSESLLPPDPHFISHTAHYQHPSPIPSSEPPFVFTRPPTPRTTNAPSQKGSSSSLSGASGYGSSSDNEDEQEVQSPLSPLKGRLVTSGGAGGGGEPNTEVDLLVTNLLDHYCDLGDVQTCVSIVMVLSSGGALNNSIVRSLDQGRIQRWTFAYIELLHRMQLWSCATTVIKYSTDDGIQRMNQVSTTMHLGCSYCNKKLDQDNPKCPNCKKAVKNPCSICNHPVQGLYVWCQQCGHGGHLDHMTEWFTSNTLCPTGCLHRCNVSGRLDSVIQQPET